jgi:hypothetical protein
MTIKNSLLIAVMLMSNTALIAEEACSISERMYFSISGTWIEKEIAHLKTKQELFSWGMGKSEQREESIPIDLGTDPPTFDRGPILRIEKLGENHYKFFMKDTFGFGNPNVILRLENNGDMFFEDAEDTWIAGGPYVRLSGPEQIAYKGKGEIINGPVDIRTIPTSSAPSVVNIQSHVMVSVTARTVNMVSINNKEDHWYKITDSSGHSGWMHGSNLELADPP